jgi:hypothetical protein
MDDVTLVLLPNVEPYADFKAPKPSPTAPSFHRLSGTSKRTDFPPDDDFPDFIADFIVEVPEPEPEPEPELELEPFELLPPSVGLGFCNLLGGFFSFGSGRGFCSLFGISLR